MPDFEGRNDAHTLEERTERALSRIFEICDQRRENLRKARLASRERGESEHFWWDEVFPEDT